MSIAGQLLERYNAVSEDLSKYKGRGTEYHKKLVKHIGKHVPGATEHDVVAAERHSYSSGGTKKPSEIHQKINKFTADPEHHKKIGSSAKEYDDHAKAIGQA